MNKELKAMKKLIADVNVNEIIYHIGQASLSSWCDMWSKAAQAALLDFESAQSTTSHVENLVGFFEGVDKGPIVRIKNTIIPQIGTTVFVAGEEYIVTDITYGYGNVDEDEDNNYVLVDVFVELLYM